MSRQRNGGSSAVESYRSQLRKAIVEFLPHQGLPLLTDDRRVRWSDRLLTIMAIMICWDGSTTLLDRFANGRQALVEMYVSRRRPGGSVEGFFKALVQRSAILLAVLVEHWRGCLIKIAGKYWKTNGWILFGVDGSKFDCPRTVANEKYFGVTGKNNSGPQLLVTCLFHVGCGVLWSWMRNGICGDGEPTQFMNMLQLLPKQALLLADAGFAGYRMMAALHARGNSFVIRVGGNRTLIRKLGYYKHENKQTVYLWPLDRQGRGGGGKNRRFIPKKLGKVQPPLVLRLIELVDAKGRPVCLLTNVLDRKLLSDHAAEKFYRMRWGIEVMWRDLKQTLSHCKLLSKTPERVEVELDWAFAGLWMLQLLGVSQLIRAKRSPKEISPAATLRTLRTAMTAKPGRVPLSKQLSIGLKDQYKRTGPKSRRKHPGKRKQTPPKPPVARIATALEKRLILRIIEQKLHNSFAA